MNITTDVIYASKTSSDLKKKKNNQTGRSRAEKFVLAYACIYWINL